MLENGNSGATAGTHQTYNGQHETVDFSFLGEPNVKNGVVVDINDSASTITSGGVGTSPHNHAVVFTIVLVAIVGLVL